MPKLTHTPTGCIGWKSWFPDAASMPSLIYMPGGTCIIRARARRDSMKRILCGIVACLLLVAPSSEARVRALLVGIDTYSSTNAPAVEGGRTSWTDLSGAVNDVVAIRDLLLARFHLPAEDVRVLTNGLATREAILRGFDEHLARGLSKGDRALFYYSGHGSQVVNSKSREADGKDETLVPADANRGVPDIRDKELRRLYNRMLDQGVHLTVIMDSCHSGSAARGLPDSSVARSLPPDPRDVADDAEAGPAPEERGALIFSAAQDYQLAREDSEEIGNQSITHGAFSLALIRTLRSLPADTPADDLFLRVRAVLKSRGWAQEPVMAGNRDRRRSALLVDSESDANASLRIPVIRVEPSGDLLLQGGHALGLTVGTELESTGVDRPARFRINRVQGLSECLASPVDKKAHTLAPGDWLVPVRWAAPERNPLTIFLPPPGPPEADIAKAAETLHAWGMEHRLAWVLDPTDQSPDWIVTWKEGRWWAGLVGATSVDLGHPPDPARLRSLAAGAEGKKLYFQAPIPADRADALRAAIQARPLLALTDDPRAATYQLAGRAADEGLQWAWVRPGLMSSDAALLLPARSDWLPASAMAALAEQAERAARVKAWLELDPPLDSGRFPYRLALRPEDGGAPIRAGSLPGGKRYRLVLQADAERLTRPYDQRFVYVFVIDSFGQRTLLFPPPHTGNVENRLPTDKKARLTEIELDIGGDALEIAEPYGMDTYVMLSTTEPIPDLQLLSGTGFRTRGADASTPAIEYLLQATSRTRGVAKPVTAPANWSIERLSFQSVPPP